MTNSLSNFELIALKVSSIKMSKIGENFTLKFLQKTVCKFTILFKVS